MLMITTCVAILAIGIIWAVLGLSGKKEKKTYHPVVGTVFHLLLNFHRYNDYLNDLNRRNTTFRIAHLSSSEIYTSDPANIEYMLKTNFANYGKGSLNYDILKDLLGNGIFTVDGEKWRRQRKMSSYEFSIRNLREFSGGVFKINAAKLAHIVSASVTSNQTIEIQDMFMKSALDSVFNVVLGVDLDKICGTNEERTEFTKAFDEASELTIFRYVDPSWRIKKFLNFGSEATLKKRVKVIDEFVYKVIQSKMDHISKPNKDLPGNKGDVLSRFIEMNETDPKYLKDIILSFVLAGKDTMAVSLSWFFYMMCKHPRLQDKIADEVRQVAKIKENSSIDDIAKNITEEALDKMQLLHAGLTETLRLYPAVPQDGKVCFSDDTFPDGYSVKKGMMVTYVPYSMGRMKSLWGEDAEEFRAERWLDQKGIFQQESPFKFTAFQAGPRICLGKEFAYRQMKVFAAVLLSAFSFRLADERKPVKDKTTITLQIDGGLHLRAITRIVN